MSLVALTALLLAPAALTAAPETPPAGGSPGEVRGSLPPPRLVPLPEEGKPVPRGAVLEEVVGTVRAVDRERHRLTIDTAAGEVTLSLDRNTLVYGPNGLATVLDLAPGSSVRAGRNAEMMAYWVTVRAPAREGEPGAAPAQGTGPGGGAGPPAGEGGPGASGAGSAGPAPTSPAPGAGAPSTGGTTP